jgi:PAS domain S-box-containing protein
MNDPLEKLNPTQAEYFMDIVATVREPLLVLDGNLRVLAANRSFYKTFKVKQKDTLGNLIYDLGNRQWDIPGLRLLLESILPGKAVFNDYEVEHDFPFIGKRSLLLNARRIPAPPKESRWILLAFEDITERARLERTLQASEQRFRRAFETAHDGMLLIEKTGGQIVNSNQAVQDMLGYSDQELLEKNVWEIGLLKNHRQFKQTALELEEHGIGVLYNTTIKHKQGGQFPADIYLMNRAAVFQCNIRDITAHVRIIEALEENEKKYFNLVDQSPDGIFLIESSGKISSVNKAICRELAFSEEELLSMNIWDIVPEQNLDQYKKRLTKILQGKNLGKLAEYVVSGKDGQLHYVEILSAPHYNGKGIVGFQGIARDVTARKQAEGTIRDLARFPSENPNPILRIAWDRSLLYANKAAFVQLASWKLEIGRPAPELLKDSIGEVFETRTSKTVQLICGDRIFSIAIEPTPSEKDVNLYGRDITMHKQADDELRESKALFETVVENIPLMIFLKEAADLRFVMFNKAGEELLGYDRKVMLGKNNLDLFPPEQADQYMTKDREVLDGEAGMLEIPEEPILTANKGQRLLHTRKICIRGADGVTKYLLGISEDITERKQAEQKLARYSEHLEEMVADRTRELREAQEKLVRHEKLVVLGQIAGSVSHELRNPLGVISNAIFYLKLVQPDADEKIKKYYDMIETETHNSEKIIGDLLEFARIKATEQKPIAAVELVQRTLDRFPVPDTIIASLKLQTDLPMVFVDPLQMEQVLGNLITNACQAMKDGGELTISAHLVVPVPERDRKKEMMAFAVNDTGVGIPPENMAKLFDPLFTTKITGIGLGLAISKKLAEANGGRIEVQSEPGKGSTFTVYLPAHSGGINDE